MSLHAQPWTRDTWPPSLRKAAALDDLARDLYARRQEYCGEKVETWPADVPFHIRAGFLECAQRVLDMLAPSHKPDSDALFTFANVLARETWFPRGGRTITLRPTEKVCGAIEPSEP